MTTNYKTSFLLPHDYEIPTFNYPEYVLPPVPYNYKTYTQDILIGNQEVLMLFSALYNSKCVEISKPYDKATHNYFDENNTYYSNCEFEIDLRQIDPTIQSIDKFISSYKTIEISNLGSNLTVLYNGMEIKDVLSPLTSGPKIGRAGCTDWFGTLKDYTVETRGTIQIDNINFENIITLYTDNIKVNDIQTFATGHTNGLPTNKDYRDKIRTAYEWQNVFFYLFLQVTKISNNDNDKIKEAYLQAYYTNDLKLKIRFTKTVIPKFMGVEGYGDIYYMGTSAFPEEESGNIIFSTNNIGVHNIKNTSNSAIKITINPR
ncbi:hypothetical protein D9R21_06870 [Spiroplasma endosymbiont of Megaselia nigra]|nr:hypothetical protein D9R21_06870 [Spiroplasma endosymbiont of Megaselia nigra]